MNKKFENIQKGDTVYTEKFVTYGLYIKKYFYVPEKVIKVTKTQFTVESGTKYRKDGSQMGKSFGKAYFLGDKAGFLSGARIIKDETDEMKAFKEKLKIEIEFIDLADKLKLKPNCDLNIYQIEYCISKLNDIKIMLDSNSN